MTRKRLLLLLCACLLILVSWFGVFSARQGLDVRTFTTNGVPMTFMAPKNGTNLPGVLVAHGFAGSKQLMYGYGHTLAHNGYGVLLWDFQGHAANANPLTFDGLTPDFEQAYAALLEQPEVDGERLALIGHSMGSGVILEAATAHPERYAAAIAISPSGSDVTPDQPRNLHLQAGTWEPQFLQRAEGLLQQAGGPNPDTHQGKGRSLVAVPNVEHITILFSDRSHQAALDWLNQTFELADGTTYRDRRMAWYALHLAAWLLLLGAALPRAHLVTPKRPWRLWGGLLMAVPFAIATLKIASPIIELDQIGGVLVGGGLGFWFLMAGSAWLSIVGRVPKPTPKHIILGLLTFTGLWFGFGALAQVVWLQWILVPPRILLWLTLSLACFPWFLASGLAQQDISTTQRGLWWLGQSVVLVVGLFLTLMVLPQLGTVFLMLPLFPVFTGILAVVAAVLNEAWAYAVGSCLFFGYAIATAFPLAT